tara:strand:- start:30164 stop:31573 length:1410 start_codon:yes stop_codon:yes gene_type:complete
MKRISILFLLFISVTSVNAQQDFTMYNIQEIPQSSYSNPSNQFNGKFYIGLPAISSIYASFTNSRFSYSDIIQKRGDSLNLNMDKVIRKAGDINYLSFNTKVDLLSFGFNVSPKTQVMVNITENASFRLNYTNDFIKFIYEGNGAFDDDVANLEGLGINLMHYREYAVGLSHQLNEKLRLGVKAKYLYGMENIYSEKTDITIRTDPETFAITANADIIVRTAGLNDIAENETETDYLLRRKNRGLGIDLGANYEVNEKLSLNASILDLGFINWNDYTRNYSNGGSSFTYNGISINAFSEEDDTIRDGNTSFDRVVDSLENEFNIDTTRNDYRSSLTTRFFIGGNYQLNKQTMLSGLFMGEIFQGQLIPAFSASIHRKMNKWIGLSASYTIFNNAYNNIGFGFNLNPGPVQIYFVSDNILGAFQPQHARYFQARVGINLIFGGQKSNEINPVYQKKVKKNKSKKSKSSEG